MGISLKLSLFVVPLIVVFIIQPSYDSIVNLKDVLLGSIAFGSTSVGFFIASVSILQTSNISKFYKHLVVLGTNKKIISWLMTAIAYMFVLSLLSLIVLIFLNGSFSSSLEVLLNFWFASLCASFLSTFWIILLFLIIFLLKAHN
ncbi:hypothetical protein P9B58_03960 [Bacillus mojavensis]|uniref:hypothetical protein n=1 Tax=Bacillus mojavensis TaxID=72360 RepID=UPI002DBD98B9|nr:hypothetical protein [Bacillus mojavensis]MEC1289436.1 hypothetical protein [Bacillus mojavensis]MEC1704673.1 hypothetical protein [Bacillus mojavensis]MEC5246170.1 hypothetical protein [Bacillus mojavensis]